MADLCRAGVPPHEGRLLYHLAARLQPAQCLELGTCLGLSAAYLAAGLAGGDGRLATLEGGAAVAQRARANLDALGLGSAEVIVGPFAETLPEVLRRHQPFDLVFIDGHHEPAALQAYADQIMPGLAEGAVLVFDDVAWTPGMRRAWRTLAARLHPAIDLLTVGLGVYRPPRAG